MELFKVFWFLFAGQQIVMISTLYNPLLTYTIRFHKLTMVPNITGNYTIDQIKEKQYINGYFKIGTDKLIDKVIVVFNRCDNGGVNCEYFQSWTLKDVCPKLKDKHQLWSRWYSSYDPPVQCPIDKVYYKQKNGTFDLGIAVTWYPEFTDYNWKVTQQFYADDIFIGSMTMHFSLFGYRKKSKLLNRNN